MYSLICMSFDGDFVKETTKKTIEECWERSNDMGSRWYFYPFHFVVTESLKTIVDVPDTLDNLKRRKVSTIRKLFQELSKLPENDRCTVDDFVFQLSLIDFK